MNAQDFQKKQPDDDSTPSTSNNQSDLFSEETTSDNNNTSITTPTLSPSQQPLPTELNVTSPSKEEYSQSENEASPVKRPRLLESTERPEETSRSKQKSRRRCFQASPDPRGPLFLCAISPLCDLSSDSCSTIGQASVSRGLLSSPKRGPKAACRCGRAEKMGALSGDLDLVPPEGISESLTLPVPGYVFCMLHRLPEQHDCTFDHMGRGREEAIMKMVKLDRKVGRSCQRIGEGCS
ncbi:AN1-type zinc finger protein 3 [Heterocephalus glaber]|uniref:AN1-type zinc finger protein 3 n=1 Tax=Heterocephalus glaber TaxID=10181 RepID=G5B9G0_HETGA|nr:AN1-type zinc finger protein 3 [Heterocephalus glaber]